MSKNMSISELTNDSGKPKWVNVDHLTKGGKILTGFETREVVRVKGAKFKVVRVQLEPAMLVLVPDSEGRV